MTYRIEYHPPRVLSLRQRIEAFRALAFLNRDEETVASLTLWLEHLEQGQ